MFSSTKSVCFSLAFLSLLFPISHSTCSEKFHDLTLTNKITNCKKLATLGAEFGWNHPQIRNNTIRIDVLFGVRQDDDIKWIAWGVNPESMPKMVGTRAIIGIVQKNSTLIANTYNITSYTKLGCELQPGKIDNFIVQNLKGGFSNSSGYLTLSATLLLNSSAYDATRLNHVWQVGYVADEEKSEPKMHPSTLQNFDSTETLNLTSEASRSIGHHRRHLRIVHGILNIVGWGTLLPSGVIIARYFRKFPFEWKQWFALHIGSQIAGYILGTAGWAIGLWLGRSSKHYVFHTHRLLAIFIFTFTTLQMLALRLRPKPHDDYRKYWDMYHHFLGYALLAVIAVNMFHGIAILKPNDSWKWAYTGVLAALGLITLGMELTTWATFLKDRISKAQPDTQSQPMPAETKPTIPENQPKTVESKPTTSQNKPNVNHNKPTIPENQPKTIESKPTTSQNKPNINDNKPTIPEPTTVENKPTTSPNKPNTNENKPITSQLSQSQAQKPGKQAPA